MEPELKGMIFQVIMSWQVIFITIALVIYIFIINKITRSGGRIRRPLSRNKVSVKKNESKAPLPVPSEDNDLGLEEEGEEEK